MGKFIINLSEILSNVNSVKKQLKNNIKLCAVVKADAYGFGAIKICSLLKRRVDYFAVARIDEFLQIKDIINKQCLILSPLFNKDLELAIKNKANITVSLNSDILKIDNLAKKLKTQALIHLKVDTGMNRFGFKDYEEFENVLIGLRKCKNIKVVGCYSHLYNAENSELVDKQLEKFNQFKKLVCKYFDDVIFHIANSEGLKNVKCQFDMVRLGIDMYMSKNNYHKLCCNIVEIKQIKKGESVGYNGTFIAKDDMKIAVCSLGYADGLFRALSNIGYVCINNKKCRIIGNICMDAFMVDISNVDAMVGDEVYIFGKNGISVCDISKLCDTIPYEIYTNISKRVKRVYVWRNNASYNRKISS